MRTYGDWVEQEVLDAKNAVKSQIVDLHQNGDYKGRKMESILRLLNRLEASSRVAGYHDGFHDGIDAEEH